MPTEATPIERFEYHGASLVDEMSGEPADGHIVFLHGWGGNRESLRGIATLFQHTHRVHLIDLPGFGEAPPPPETWGTNEYADLVQQYLLDRVQAPVVIVGHSFGGRVTVRLAARRLSLIREIVLIGVPGLPQPALSRKRLRGTAIRMLRRLLILLRPIVGDRGVRWHSERFGSKDYQAAGVLRPVLVRTVTEDLTESASTITCPALLVWGAEDAEAPLWQGRRYAELLGSRATMFLLPHKDHFPYTGTGAHLIGQKMRTWMTRGHHD
ncbi:MAG: alpha/beta fold hydrolase [Vicinamibacterales bacterium]